MPTKVSVNKMTVVHKSSTGISSAFPDVCKTPAAPSPIPIPYPNIAMSSDSADTASTVKADGNPIMLKSSKFSMSSGNEAGSLMGIMSNKNKGSANPVMFSMDVKADGENVFRQLDIMLQNGGSKPINTPPFPNNQPPAPAMGGGDPEDMKIIKVDWSETKLKCGDPVKIDTKTENYKDGMPILHVLHNGKSKKSFEMLTGGVKGDAVQIDWVTKHGKWRKKATKLKIKAHGFGGVVKSSNELEIEIPEEVPKETVKSRGTLPVPTHNNDVQNWKYGLKKQQKIVETPSASDPSFRARLVRFFGMQDTQIVEEIVEDTSKAWGNDYAYDMSVEKGRWLLHCKIELIDHIKPSLAHRRQKKRWKKAFRRKKKLWKKTIEDAWDQTRCADNSWNEHRVDCQRGSACDCTSGCCIFPLHVKVSFVTSGAHKQVDLKPGAADPNVAGQWWNASTWFRDLGGSEGNPGNYVYVHEFGHNIGLWDEYLGGAVYPQFAEIPGSLMCDGTELQIQHFNFHPEPGKSFHDWFKGKMSDTYELIDKKNP